MSESEGSVVCPPRNDKQIPRFARDETFLKEISVAILCVFRVLRVKPVLCVSGLWGERLSRKPLIPRQIQFLTSQIAIL